MRIENTDLDLVSDWRIQHSDGSERKYLSYTWKLMEGALLMATSNGRVTQVYAPGEWRAVDCIGPSSRCSRPVADNRNILIGPSDLTKSGLQDWVREVCLVAGVSSTELAHRAGLAASTLNRFLNDATAKHSISASSIGKIKKAAEGIVRDRRSGGAK